MGNRQWIIYCPLPIPYCLFYNVDIEVLQTSEETLMSAETKSFVFVNEPDGQRSTVRPQASFSLFARAFLSDEVPPPLS
ncbi:MAG TPA: hypothetical protein DCQ51_07370 [Planktothrix sp. UBA8407]|jgi:hypothetical protein|nr:hypothetical protein [Planktothrix sp. UBA8407]